MIGPSGCGKSTLLRVLNRMYDLYPGQRATGEVMMDDMNIIDPGVDLNALRARMGQAARLYAEQNFADAIICQKTLLVYGRLAPRSPK